jgi:tetratricopeptide (TPR) repeat protein
VEDQASALSRLTHNNRLWLQLINPANMRKAAGAKPQMAPTLHSKVLGYHVQYRDAIRSGKNEDAKKSLNKLVEELEKHPRRLKEDMAIYLTSLNNLISYLVFTEETEEALMIVNKAKTFYRDLQHLNRTKANFRLILRTYNIELEIYRDKESLEKAISLINDILELLEGHRGKAPESYLISLWFQFAYIYFLRKEFRISLHWLNEILNSTFADKRKDLYLQAHLLNLMVHFELRNFFVMRYFVASAKRFFSRNTALLPYHTILLSFFIKVSGAPDSEHQSLFRKLNNDLFSAAETIPASELDYINWKKWISGKSLHS